MQCDQLPYEKGEFGHKCIHKENAAELEGRNQGAASTSQAALKMAYTPLGTSRGAGTGCPRRPQEESTPFAP